MQSLCPPQFDPDPRRGAGSTWNIGFIAAGETVVWPDAAVLPGVTMALLRGANDRHFAQAIPLGQIGRMHAAFATNASIGVRPISAIDGHHFDPDHPAVAGLQRTYAAIPAHRI